VSDLRYNTTIPLETVRTGLQEHLSEFKNEERIEGQTFMLQIGPDGKPISQITDNKELQDIIRYRFRNPETNEFIQLGHGILSLNSVHYSGFNDFFAKLESVITKHEEIVKPTTYRRIALRYINHMPLEDMPERVFAWLAPIPQEWGKRSTVQSIQQSVLRIGEDQQDVTIAYPQVNLNTGKNIMVLDIDHHVDFVLPVLSNVNQLYNWVKEAHEQVYETFKSVLKQEYFKELL
jgi:uncharacterized protein (TIGR04255 family)